MSECLKYHNALGLISPDMDNTTCFLEQLNYQGVIRCDVVNLGHKACMANPATDGNVLLSSLNQPAITSLINEHNMLRTFTEMGIP
jgi:actin-related protein